MRIGLIAPPWVPVPPPAYGGTEAVVDNLARGLAALGHDVRLFTVGESTCPVPKSHLYDRPFSPIGVAVPEAAHVLAAYEELSDVDIIHDHTALGPLIGPRPDGSPVVSTCHGPFDPMNARNIASFADRVTVVAISYAQTRFGAPIPIDTVIHHGIDLDTYRYGPGGGGYLMWIGRMCAAKGAHRAVEFARAAGRKLVLVSKIREAEEREFYEREVRPLLGPDDPEPQELGVHERVRLLRSADALLNPIDWPEPFGLVMAEALACGTPVLAFPKGAAPKIVDPGRTGFLCADRDSMLEAIERIPDLDHRDCRAAAERRFSLERMARDHVALYLRVLDRAAAPAITSVRPAIASVLPATGAVRTVTGVA
ncbi:glycosyltransferase family 4 protein [Nocardia seriolae]|uniref:Spore coat protein n=1 Tax=Nocardia seriolae TaxID=37332 RepID=A0A0B8NHQ9_9NOCA|nr:glycosyltransferase family 4 protein [Nocardia seriolae]APA98455.1 Spore coat protein [Nocardia seriolae]MTJ64083.1 glycosyltransferase [Nocardia seriolae]MTJ74337.1 glycosyltransferase [Nocardia seriolae]MTJ88138.1 glycosyltransferase [Nocardia seriolae]MTK32127.1 glycosyltransferase [Nocardia seriolae]